MSNEKILHIFYEFESTLKERSLDETQNVHMTELDILAFDFDEFKEDYARKRQLQDKPCSCDALFMCLNNELHLIEFRNAGSMRTFGKQDVRNKIYDSLLIFADVTNEKISSTTQYLNLIIVYNEIINQKEEIKKSKKLEQPQSKNFIANSVAKSGDKNIIKFGLGSFKDFCFKNVFTLTPVEFEQHINKLSTPQ